MKNTPQSSRIAEPSIQSHPAPSLTHIPGIPPRTSRKFRRTHVFEKRLASHAHTPRPAMIKAAHRRRAPPASFPRWIKAPRKANEKKGAERKKINEPRTRLISLEASHVTHPRALEQSRERRLLGARCWLIEGSMPRCVIRDDKGERGCDGLQAECRCGAEFPSSSSRSPLQSGLV